MNREQRDRMTETFVAVGDALRRTPIPTFTVMAPKPETRRPFYLPEAPPQTVSQYRNTLAKWGKLGIVKGVN
jgi:hypothetical protein